MAQRRTQPREVAHLRERVEALERRMASIEALQQRAARVPTVVEAGGRPQGLRFGRRRSDPELSIEGDVEANGVPDGARLLATQMILAGHSRASVAEYLQQTFDIEDPDPILDAIGVPAA